MADDVVSGEYTFATDEISDRHFPKEKLVYGADGTATDVTLTSAFPVQPGTATTWTVSGTVAATQSGTWTEANSAAIAASLAVMDDWDESDRLKTNPIAGQAGVAGGSGTVSALTQRVVLATDVALPTGTNTLGKLEHTTTGLGHGVKTVAVAGTDEALAASTPAKWVCVQAQTDNTGKIAVGATGVDATVATGTGVLLNAGDAQSLMIDNLADVFIDATVSGDGVRFVYGT